MLGDQIDRYCERFSEFHDFMSFIMFITILYSILVLFSYSLHPIEFKIYVMDEHVNYEKKRIDY